MKLLELYNRLLEAYGPQGWWPLLSHMGTNPTKTGSVSGYHVGDYSFPRNPRERFEICLGAILTQNTAWPNVERALRNLEASGALTPEGLAALSGDRLKAAIRPSGYFNVKSRKLREFGHFYQSLQGAVPTRGQLLGVWGIGPETADSIRLYAYRQPEMVVDAYTRRIMEHLGLAVAKDSYSHLKHRIEEALPAQVEICQEFHALMVEHAKRHYRRRPYRDPILA